MSLSKLGWSLVVLTLAACITPSIDAVDSSMASTEVETAHRGSGARAFGVTHTAFLSDVYMVSVEIPWSGNEVHIHVVELDPSSGDWDRWRRVEPIGFLAQAAGLRHGNELYVVGRDLGTGHTVVERWDRPAEAGGYVCTRPAAAESIGTPIRTPDSYIEIDGGHYIKPPVRGTAPQVVRTRVYDGPSLGDVYRLVVDPDGRHMVMHVRSSSLGPYSVVQLPLSPAGAPIELLNSQAAPELTQRMEMFAAQHGRLGRVFVLQNPEWTTWFEDTRNDGIVDHWDHLETGQHRTMFPLHQWSRWWP